MLNITKQFTIFYNVHLEEKYKSRNYSGTCTVKMYDETVSLEPGLMRAEDNH